MVASSTRTTQTAFDKLVDAGVRVGISPPKIDPLGDHTDRLFELMDQLRPRSGTAIRSRAALKG
jgi:ABC-type molybdate transport system substrate-binding protein